MVCRKVRLKDLIGRYGKMVCRPKDMIGRYKKMVRRKVRPKDLIRRAGKMVCMKIRPKDLIGQEGKMVRMKVRPKDLIGRDRKMVRMKVRRSDCLALWRLAGVDSYWTVISRSHSLENLQDRMVRIVSANQITWTVIQPFYHVHILRRIYKIGWSELYRPIISLGRLFNRYKRSQSSEASSWSDGQTLKLKSLTRKSWTITSAIKSLTRKSRTSYV